MFARALHDHSADLNQPFIKLNCAALPDGLIESALLGHERGAFSGAVRRVEGAFERTSGGTLVLEEVEALAPEFQARLLRVLETGEFTRMGGSHPMPVDVRLISTATRRLSEQVAAGRFLEALYRKLAAVVIELPPLRERREDIPALVRHFTQLASSEVEKAVPAVAPEALAILRDYAWPGNVRELRHSIERAVILSHEPVLQAHLFEQERGMQSASLVQQVMQRASSYGQPALNVGLPQGLSTPPAGIILTTLRVEEAERALIKRALEVTGGNRTRTAELLGISVRTLRNKLNGPQRVATPG
jgi:DNA-binding NtrC family response regulator